MKSLSSLRFVLTAHVLVLCVQGPFRVVAAEPGPIGGIRLSVTRTPTHAVLSWPRPDGNFVLESTTSLSSTDWHSVSEMFTITDGSCEVTVLLGQGQRYFRLREWVATEFFPTAGGGSGAPTNGYITAVLRSECADAPPPPPVGEIAVGTNYVIKTIADADPLDYKGAQQLVTDGIFESLMPLYCALQGNGCVTNRVQWNLLAYDAGGNPRISGSPLSGAGFHYCAVTEGYLVAAIGGASASPPPPPPVGQVAIGTDCVIMTLADGDPMNLEAAQQLATDSVFELLKRQYCALPRGTGSGQVSGQARWSVATYDAAGTLKLLGCAASGCDLHECGVARGYITAVLRSECADAPPPPPVGEIAVGTNYVIKTIADVDPLDYEGAQQLVTDGMFESLMPLYCALQGNGCVTNRVQWNLMTYDAGGNPRISGGPLSGPGFHYCR